MEVTFIVAKAGAAYGHVLDGREIETVAGFFEILSVVDVADESAKLGSLLVKVAVTAWLPAVRADTVVDAALFATATGAKGLPSTEKVTKPVGVPKVELIAALSVTVLPTTAGEGVKPANVSETGKGALLPTCTISSVGGVPRAAFEALPEKVAVLV